jgi:hypothetical protein
MRFERGKSPRRSMRIGKAGDPIEISGILIESPYKNDHTMQHCHHLDDDTVINVLNYSKHSIPILESDIEEGPYGIKLRLSRQSMDQNRVEYMSLEDAKGEYVKFKGELYPILFPYKVDMSIKLDWDE